MDEELFTRDSPKESPKMEEGKKKKSHADKLMNEDSAAENYRKKLRHGKKDNRLTKEEAKKAKQLKQQGRRRIKNEILAKGKIHHEVNKTNEDDNVAVEAVNDSAMVAEGGIYKLQSSSYSSKYNASKRGRAASSGAGGAADASTVSNPKSKQLQKELMKKEYKEYAIKKSAKETANQAGSLSKKFTDKAEDLVGKIGEWVVEHVADNPIILLIALIILIVVLVISGALSSCAAVSGGVQNITVATSFTAQDHDIINVDADYTDLETDLQTQINNIETDYPGYDEYNYTLDEIGHNPYELAALLTVLYEDYTRAEVQSKLSQIFDKQYDLEIEEVVETRTRTETRTGYQWVDTGEVDGVPTG